MSIQSPFDSRQPRALWMFPVLLALAACGEVTAISESSEVTGVLPSALDTTRTAPVISPELFLFTANNNVICPSSTSVLDATCTRTTPSSLFRVVIRNAQTGEVAIQAPTGRWVAAQGGGGSTLVADRTAVGPWETFKLIELGNGRVALKTINGQYVCAEGGGGGALLANRSAVGSWETFQKVTPSKVALQVSTNHFVAAVGGGGSTLEANRTAVGPWETLQMLSFVDGRTLFESNNGAYLTAVAGGGSAVMADKSAIGSNEIFTRGVLSNGISLRSASNHFVAAEGGGGGALVANRTVAGAWETFRLTCLANGMTKVCGTSCVDTSTHAEHCGGCGIRCGVGEGCKSGYCFPQACTVETDCPVGASCRDGACRRRCTANADCPSGAVCSSGTCATVTSDGGTLVTDGGVKPDGGTADAGLAADGGIADAGIGSDAGTPVPNEVLQVLAAKPYTEGTCQATTFAGWPYPAQQCSYVASGVSATVTTANPPALTVGRWVMDAAELIPTLRAIKSSHPAEYQRALVAMALHTMYQSGRVFPLAGDLFVGMTTSPFDRGITKDCTTGCYCRLNSIQRTTWCQYQESTGAQTFSACMAALGSTGLTDAWAKQCMKNHADGWNSERNPSFRALAFEKNKAVEAACPNGACTPTQIADAVVAAYGLSPGTRIPTSVIQLLAPKPYTEGTCQATVFPGWPHAAQQCSYVSAGMTSTVITANPSALTVAGWIVDAAELIPRLRAIKTTNPEQYERALLAIARHTMVQSGRIFPLAGNLVGGTTLSAFDRGIAKGCTTGCYCRINSIQRTTWCQYQESLGVQTYTACMNALGSSGLTDAWARQCMQNHADAWGAERNHSFRALAFQKNKTIEAACPEGVCTPTQIADAVVAAYPSL